jgi:hypothetical protein
VRFPLVYAVPSYKRATEVENYGLRAEANTMVEDDNAEDGWVAPPALHKSGDAEEIPFSQPQASTEQASAEQADLDVEDIPDIDELELEDEAAEADEVNFLLWCAHA